jgi:hypothetical protein
MANASDSERRSKSRKIFAPHPPFLLDQSYRHVFSSGGASNGMMC